MTLKEKLDIMVDEGWLVSQVHPREDLTIYNYSQKTQYESHWTPDTLMARGLVLDGMGNIIARPFPKFFNASEVAEQIPAEPFEVYEKMDGSLGIFFWYNGNPYVASRGSFTSEQAVRARKMLEKLPYHLLLQNHTYMFEIIYPENRIVVDYGDAEKVVLLGAIHTPSGAEMPREVLEIRLGDHFELVNRYHFTESWDHLKSRNEPNMEGYVLRYTNGFRVKVKFEEYVRLHRIITNVSNVDIWETLSSGRSFTEFLEKVPDEFYEWVRGVENSLREAHAEILWDAHELMNRVAAKIGHGAERKLWALEMEGEKLRPIVFNFLDGNFGRAHAAAWRIVKPKWSKPFFQVREAAN